MFISYNNKTAELLYQAKKVDPKMLFCHEKNMNWGKLLAKDLEHHVVTVAMSDFYKKDNNEHVDNKFEDLFNYDHKKSKCLNKIPVPCRDVNNDVAIITMSSGTTGKPKAVPATHMNCISDLGSKFSKSNYTQFRFACSASLDYVSGRLVVLGAIESGYAAVIINGFEPKSYCQAIQDYKINLVYLGAASFYNFITYPNLYDYDLSSIRIVFPMGAKIIYLDELRVFFEKVPSIKFVRQGYGASEVSGVAMNALTPEEYLKDCCNCGKLLQGVQAKIVDPINGELLGNNQEGLVHVKSLRTFPGYYDVLMSTMNNNNYELENKQQQQSPFVKDLSVYDEDGFYKTGDLGYFNEKDELYTIGRRNELMSCRGAKKVLPQELEELIDTHPAVHKVCVLGIQHRREPALHCPRAFIVVKENYYHDQDDIQLSDSVTNDEKTNLLNGEELTRKGQHKLCNLSKEKRHLIEEDIMKFVNERIGWEKQLTGGIIILDDIGTRGATGKVHKSYLRSLDLEQVEIYGDRSS